MFLTNFIICGVGSLLKANGDWFLCYWGLMLLWVGDGCGVSGKRNEDAWQSKISSFVLGVGVNEEN